MLYFNFWILSPFYYRLQPKIQKSGSRLLLGLLKGFQNGMLQSHSAKTHKEDRIPGNGLFARPGAGVAGSPAQQYDFWWVLTVKFWPRFNLRVKSFSIYANRQTHTLCIPIGRDEIF